MHPLISFQTNWSLKSHVMMSKVVWKKTDRKVEQLLAYKTQDIVLITFYIIDQGANRVLIMAVQNSRPRELQNMNSKTFQASRFVQYEYKWNSRLQGQKKQPVHLASALASLAPLIIEYDGMILYMSRIESAWIFYNFHLFPFHNKIENGYAQGWSQV